MKQAKGVLYSNGVSESLFKNIITKDIYVSLIKADTIDKFFDILSQTSFEIGDRAFFQKQCDENLKKLIEFVKEESPNEELKNFFVLTYDYQNISNYCKCSLQGLDFIKYCEAEGMYSFAQIKDYISNKEYKKFGNKTIEECLKSFDQLTGGGSYSSTEIDFVFKKFMFDNLRNLVKKNKLLRELLTYLISIENISVAIRSASTFELESQFLDGGIITKNQLTNIFNGEKFDLSEFDDFIIHFIEIALKKPKKHSDYIDFERKRNEFIENYFYFKKSNAETFAPFAYYIYKKLNEIKNVRLIYSFISNKLNEEIKDRLLGG